MSREKATLSRLNWPEKGQTAQLCLRSVGLRRRRLGRAGISTNGRAQRDRHAHLRVRAGVLVLEVFVGQCAGIELEVAVLGGNDRALDMRVLLRADVHGIAADDARLPVHPDGRGGAGAEALCAMVLFPIQLSKNKKARRWAGPGGNCLPIHGDKSNQALSVRYLPCVSIVLHNKIQLICCAVVEIKVDSVLMVKLWAPRIVWQLAAHSLDYG